MTTLVPNLNPLVLSVSNWSSTGLPYYAGVPGVPSAFQYGPTVFVPPASAKQPAMGLANPSNQFHQQHQPSYGQHAYGTGELRIILKGSSGHCSDFCFQVTSS